VREGAGVISARSLDGRWGSEWRIHRAVDHSCFISFLKREMVEEKGLLRIAEMHDRLSWGVGNRRVVLWLDVEGGGLGITLWWESTGEERDFGELCCM